MKEKSIWRYYSLLKFMDFINGNLHFSRADQFEDKFEGRFPKKVVKDFEAVFKYNPLESSDTGFDRVEKSGELLMKEIRDLELRHKKCVAISCWHLNEFESAAMWNTYSHYGYGIAVKTRIEKLENISIPNGYEFHKFPVLYEDFEELYDPNMFQYAFLPYMYKRKSFEHEKEYRLILYKEIADPKVKFSLSNESYLPVPTMQKFEVLNEKGINISIDAKEIIDEVVLSPFMREWEVEIIQQYLQKLGYEARVSDLMKDVYY